MDVDRLPPRRLQQTLRSLSQEVGRVTRASPDPVPPGPLYAAPKPRFGLSLPMSAKQLAAAGSGARSLAVAEARLDAEMVGRVFRLAKKVLEAGGGSADREELAARMRAFSASVATVRAQLEPPHGSVAIPLPEGSHAGVSDTIATRAEVDQGVAEAAVLLERVREEATAQAERVLASVDRADALNRSLYGQPDGPAAPSDAAELGGRLDAAAAFDGGAGPVQRLDEIQAVRSGFDDSMLAAGAGLAGLRARVASVEEAVRAASAASAGAGGL